MTKRELLHRILYPHGKVAFISSLDKGAAVLDAGCGNNSPYWAKTQRPDLYYIGLDISDYNQTYPVSLYANEYFCATPEQFHIAIRSAGNVDAVISSHNLEHCNHPILTLEAMCNILKPEGQLYLSFPSSASLRFKRSGISFKEDSTHKTVLPFNGVLSLLKHFGMNIEYRKRRYRPLLAVIIGLLNEPVSAARNKAMRGTPELYGFESIIWARKDIK